jgi:threonine dehydrogenase-like Zn-dependent dehydrogenase
VLAAVTRSPGEMVLEDVPDSGPARAGNVIVRPEAVGICGSDFHLFSGQLGAISGARDFYPRIQGHELSALVEDPGTARADIKQGDRVAILPLLPCGRCYPCRIGRPNVCPRFRLVGVHTDGGLQQRLEVPAPNVFGVGDLEPDATAFVEPASIVVHALARGRLQPGEQVVVFGAGPIGLAAVLAATHAGARVLAVDPMENRRDLAKRLGAEHTAWTKAPAEITEWTNGDGPPLIVETSGEVGVLPQAIEMVSPAGRIVVVGMSEATTPVRPGAFPEKEIDVIGTSCATAEDFQVAIDLIKASTITAIFSHHFPLARAAEAFDFAMSRPPDAIKVIVTIEQ